MINLNSRWAHLCASTMLLVLAEGCDKAPGSIPSSDEEEPTASRTVSAPREKISKVAVAGSTVTVGFAHGKLRKDVALNPFKISKFPITVEQYAECVAAGVCELASDACGEASTTSAEAQTTAETNAGEETSTVALCADLRGAEAFCEWHGASLPSLAQWSLAARGPQPKRFSWGDEMPECRHHPGGRELPSPNPTGEIAVRVHARRQGLPCRLDAGSWYQIGKHTAGASEFGIQDVLLAPGELLRTDQVSPFPACGSDREACVVYGLKPGSIDSVRTIEPRKKKAANDDESASDVANEQFGFRCVWDGEG